MILLSTSTWETIMKPAVLLLVLLALPAFADPKFEENKARALTEIDEHLSKMQEHKTCVSGASDKDALKACHNAMKEWRRGEKVERMAKRKQHMEERMKKMNKGEGQN